ncbi:mitochondrial matrix Mmp37 [Polychytrium aggregatum]|uniref:mitochondrial matrix Mmp37 n=1 Tax=Polychytrium aggregatum TaxID=110093 RepID=UPI0022FF22C9|nr:mitochondrial matrix Mmp37 [Polychytrium aggregatum]KAI9206532.1 mitochondrial matrix Mmp37 [Polychytrium aggregatum]
MWKTPRQPALILRLPSQSWLLRTDSKPIASAHVSLRHFSALPLDPEAKAQKGRLEQVIKTFAAPIRYAIAYGSGVFKQHGYSDAKLGSKDAPMVDFIFGVTHPEHWHSLNMRENPSHYSAVRYLGSRFVSVIQENFGGHIYYNPYCTVDGLTIKYGVVSIDRLNDDLKNWRTMYLAGRMQKPVMTLREDARVQLANQTNLENAVRVALLLLPSEFTEEELFIAIAGLSYRGDFRMQVGENPHKIRNIVTSQLPLFRAMYQPIIENMPNVNYVQYDNERLQQDEDVKVRGQMLQKLPKSLQERIQTSHRWYISRTRTQAQTPIGEPLFSQSVVSSPHFEEYVGKGLARVVGRPALVQSIKGLVTAGPARSAAYVSAKLKKRVGSK